MTSAVTLRMKRPSTQAAGLCTERGAEESRDLEIKGGDPQPQEDLRNLAQEQAVPCARGDFQSVDGFIECDGLEHSMKVPVHTHLQRNQQC